MHGLQCKYETQDKIRNEIQLKAPPIQQAFLQICMSVSQNSWLLWKRPLICWWRPSAPWSGLKRLLSYHIRILTDPMTPGILNTDLLPQRSWGFWPEISGFQLLWQVFLWFLKGTQKRWGCVTVFLKRLHPDSLIPGKVPFEGRIERNLISTYSQ